jgi:glycosyltransferase involved in cell wall biosynthesis
MKKLSIIIPAYNVESYIERCLDSICSQITEGEHIEVIVVDDGSKDGTVDIVTTYTHHFPFLRLISQDNSGPSVARNRGLDEATGEYIWFVDSDDYITPSAIVHICEHINKAPQTNVFFGKIYCGSTPIGAQFKNKTYTSEEFLGNTPYFYTHPMIYRKQFLEDRHLKFGTYRNIEDLHFNLRVLFFAKNVTHIDHFLYHYEIRPNSISSTRDKKHLLSLSEQTVLVLIDLKTFLDKQHANSAFYKILYHNINGLFFSWLRFNYPVSHVKEKIQDLRQINLYPSGKTLNKRSNQFSLFSNRENLFLFCLKVKNLFSDNQ